MSFFARCHREKKNPPPESICYLYCFYFSVRLVHEQVSVLNEPSEVWSTIAVVTDVTIKRILNKKKKKKMLYEDMNLDFDRKIYRSNSKTSS